MGLRVRHEHIRPRRLIGMRVLKGVVHRLQEVLNIIIAIALLPVALAVVYQ